MSRFNAIEDVWKYLDSIPMFQKSGVSAANFSLDNIRDFCEKLGNPQDKYPTIHIAGTNGKGTTCYLLEKIYSDAGYKTGLFTSPHLLRYNERVRVEMEEISDSKLVDFFQTAEILLGQIKLSYFEISTALAFWHFAKQKVDIAIIETGLGGRLDSTNIITPEISVITSIGLDHQNVLGNSMDKIAREKGGIIKQGKPVVIGNVSGIALQEIQEMARKNESNVYLAQKLNPEWKSGLVTLKNGEVKIQTGFKEAINKWNVGCAWLVAEVLQKQFPLKEERIIESVKSFIGAPARFEKLHPEYEWYFSGSHNIQALQSSLQAVEELKSKSDAVLIFSVLKDKLSKELLQHLQGFKKAYFVEQEGERAAKVSDIIGDIPAIKVEESRIEIILNELKTELVIFIGSFYFYPIVKRWMKNLPY